MSTQVVGSPTDGNAVNQFWKIGVTAGILAAAGNLLVMIVGKNLLDVPFMVPSPDGSDQSTQISLLDVVLSSILPALGATILFVILQQISAHPVRLFLAIAGLLFLFSFFLLLVETDPSTRICLGLMHLIAAGITIGLLVRQ